MSVLLHAHRLSIGYQGPIQKGLEFGLKRGEILFVRGANGAGKSTLIKTLLGEMKPLDGDVYWSVPRQNIAFFPQRINHDFPLAITLWEICEIFELAAEVRELLPERLHARLWREASGGEKQKTLILSRIREGVEVLVLDEPFNHMDRENIDMVSMLLRDLVEKGIIGGMVIVSHIDSSVLVDRDFVKGLALS